MRLSITQTNSLNETFLLSIGTNRDNTGDKALDEVDFDKL